MGAASVNTQYDVRGELRFAESMVRHTSWRAGGNAAVFFIPADQADLVDFVRQLESEREVLWLGLGSNLLVRDGGFSGVVIDTRKALADLKLNSQGLLRAGAGVPGAKLARFAVANGFRGAEFFAGIPGTVGGALAMNAGAWGGETWQCVKQVETLSRQAQITTRTSQEYKVGYRSVSGPDDWFLSATFDFQKAPQGFDGVLEIKSMLAQRAASQPVQSANAGSVFRNPEGDYAARLIESCGLKGSRKGGAQIAEKHANFIINNGNATAADIEFLIDLAQRRVLAEEGVSLQTEVRIVGGKIG
ncbi:MAG TPA: UDP-N-acetylenolpyruvoylglucosamine reductase [Gammaproteobacteria bacterium]|jgi:UDP-N-acetylmuramate dehydrogenase|nr:UDP-N-acetylenolpyruvoylglucosamine reductase [Gammaproteobacteria bacterium]